MARVDPCSRAGRDKGETRGASICITGVGYSTRPGIRNPYQVRPAQLQRKEPILVRLTQAPPNPARLDACHSFAPARARACHGSWSLPAIHDRCSNHPCFWRSPPVLQRPRRHAFSDLARGRDKGPGPQLPHRQSAPRMGPLGHHITAAPGHYRFLAFGAPSCQVDKPMRRGVNLSCRHAQRQSLGALPACLHMSPPHMTRPTYCSLARPTRGHASEKGDRFRQVGTQHWRKQTPLDGLVAWIFRGGLSTSRCH